MREVLMEEMRDVGRESESSIAMMVLWIERTLEWKVVIGEDVVGLRIWT